MAKGRILDEMLVSPPAVKETAWNQPAVACANGKVHVAWSTPKGGNQQIAYARSHDNGATWTGFSFLSNAVIACDPSIAAEGDRVAVAWVAMRLDGSWQVAFRESTDGGNTWSMTSSGSGIYSYRADLFPHVEYLGGYLHLAWNEAPMTLFLSLIRDGAVLSVSPHKTDFMAGKVRCAPSPDGAHVVFMKYIEVENNWDIMYTRCYNNQWSIPVNISDSAGDSLRPDIIWDGSAVHVVWAEKMDGIFKVVVRSSPDGITWDDPFEVVAGQNQGSWHPRIAAAGSNVLLTVWEDLSLSGSAVYSSKSTDGGASWSTPSQLTPLQYRAICPDMDIDSQGRFHVFTMQGSWPSNVGYFNYDL